jgi:hypothetical protein
LQQGSNDFQLYVGFVLQHNRLVINVHRRIVNEMCVELRIIPPHHMRISSEKSACGKFPEGLALSRAFHGKSALRCPVLLPGSLCRPKSQDLAYEVTSMVMNAERRGCAFENRLQASIVSLGKGLTVRGVMAGLSAGSTIYDHQGE